MDKIKGEQRVRSDWIDATRGAECRELRYRIGIDMGIGIGWWLFE